MKRKEFLKKSLMGAGVITILPMAASCSSDDDNGSDPSNCDVTPTEIAGPFPIMTPAQQVQANIIGNRNGIALQINFTIQKKTTCAPLSNVFVDLWQCDSRGNYSEYSGQEDGDFSNEDFLRGRQTTNAEGKVSFISIYPGWYPGRAPHLHLEVRDANENSLLITQVAFPENISNSVYATTGYTGNFDTANSNDLSFSNSLQDNLPDSITGDNTNGYVYNKIITVA